MKKILKSILTLGVVAVVAFTGANAFFSDTETSVGNTFTAGDIDLQIDNTSYVIDYLNPDITSPTGAIVASTQTSWSVRDLTIERFFDFLDLKPGDFGEDTISVHVGSNDAWVCAAAQITEDNDNTYTDPEEDDDSTVLVDPTTTDGELDEEVNFAFWADDGDNVYESDEEIFLSGPMSALGGAGQMALADSGSSILTGGGPMPGGSTSYIGKYWCYGTMDETPVTQDGGATGNPTTLGTGFACSGASVDNASQTDVVVADLQFYAVQARNNDQFLCSQWLPEWPEVDQLPPVGAALSAYTAPNCTITISNDIQGAVNAATSGDTICVNDGTYNETVTIDKPLTLASVNGPTNTATITGGVRVESNDVTVTGFIINPGSFLGTNASLYLNGSLSNILLSYNDINGLDEAESRGVETTIGSTYSNVSIMNNIVHDLTTGIYTNPHTGLLEVTYNDLYDNAASIGGYTGAHVAYNEFSSTGEAIGADSSYDGATVEFNNFLTGADVNTYGSLTLDVVAPNNFWAEGSANQIGGTLEVDATPETGSQYPHN